MASKKQLENRIESLEHDIRLLKRTIFGLERTDACYNRYDRKWNFGHVE